jgi:hypothetical protein
VITSENPLGDDIDRLALCIESYLFHHPDATYQQARAFILSEGWESEEDILTAWIRAQGMTR